MVTLTAVLGSGSSASITCTVTALVLITSLVSTAAAALAVLVLTLHDDDDDDDDRLQSRRVFGEPFAFGAEEEDEDVVAEHLVALLCRFMLDLLDPRRCSCFMTPSPAERMASLMPEARDRRFGFKSLLANAVWEKTGGE